MNTTAYILFLYFLSAAIFVHAGSLPLEHSKQKSSKTSGAENIAVLNASELFSKITPEILKNPDALFDNRTACGEQCQTDGLPRTSLPAVSAGMGTLKTNKIPEPSPVPAIEPSHGTITMGSAQEQTRTLQPIGPPPPAENNQPAPKTAWENAKSIASDLFKGYGEVTGTIFSPFQTAVYGLQGYGMIGESYFIGSVLNDKLQAAFVKLHGIYTLRQSQFNKWLGAGAENESQIIAAYHDAMSRIDEAETRGQIEKFLDTKIMEQRRQDPAKDPDINADAQINDTERAYMAAMFFGLGNFASQRMERGRREWEKGNSGAAVSEYAKSAFVIGLETTLTCGLFGSAAAPLKMTAAGAVNGLSKSQMMTALQKAGAIKQGAAWLQHTKSELQAIQLLNRANKLEMAAFMSPMAIGAVIDSAGLYQTWNDKDPEARWAHFHSLYANAAGFAGTGIGLNVPKRIMFSAFQRFQKSKSSASDSTGNAKPKEQPAAEKASTDKAEKASAASASSRNEADSANSGRGIKSAEAENNTGMTANDKLSFMTKKPVHTWTIEEQAQAGAFLSHAHEVSVGFLKDPKTQAYIETIVEKLNKQIGYIDHPLKVHLLLNDTKNAAALVGGHIFVNVGLLKSVRFEDELAAVLGHELAHLKLKHSAKQSKTDEELKKNENGAGASFILNPRYSQEHEFEADQYGAQAAAAAGYHPLGMAFYYDKNFLPKWLEHAAERDKVIDDALQKSTKIKEEKKETIKKMTKFADEWFQTHPPADKRAERILRLFDNNQDWLERPLTKTGHFSEPEQWIALLSGAFETKLKVFLDRFPTPEKTNDPKLLPGLRSPNSPYYRDHLLMKFLIQHAKTIEQLKSGIQGIRTYNEELLKVYMDKGMALAGLDSGLHYNVSDLSNLRTEKAERIIAVIQDLIHSWPIAEIKTEFRLSEMRIIDWDRSTFLSGDLENWLRIKIIPSMLKGARSASEIDAIAKYVIQEPHLRSFSGELPNFTLDYLADYCVKHYARSAQGPNTNLGYIAYFLTLGTKLNDHWSSTLFHAMVFPERVTKESLAEFFARMPRSTEKTKLYQELLWHWLNVYEISKDKSCSEYNKRKRVKFEHLVGERFEDTVDFLVTIDPLPSFERDQALLGYIWQAHPYHSRLPPRKVIDAAGKYLTEPVRKKMEELAAKNIKNFGQAREAALQTLYELNMLNYHLGWNMESYTRARSPDEAAAFARFARKNGLLRNEDKTRDLAKFSNQDHLLSLYAFGQKNRMRNKKFAKGNIADTIHEFEEILQIGRYKKGWYKIPPKAFDVFVDRVLAEHPMRFQIEQIFDLAQTNKAIFPAAADILAKKYVDMLVREGKSLPQILQSITLVENKLITPDRRNESSPSSIEDMKRFVKESPVQPTHFEHLRLAMFDRLGKSWKDVELTITSMQPSSTSNRNKARAALKGYERALQEGWLGKDPETHFQAIVKTFPEPSPSRDRAVELALDSFPVWQRQDVKRFERLYFDFGKQAGRVSREYEADLQNPSNKMKNWSFLQRLEHLEGYFPEGSRVRDRYLTALMDNYASTTAEVRQAKALLFDNLPKRTKEASLYFQRHEDMLRPENRNAAFAAVTAGTLAESLIAYFIDSAPNMSAYPPEVRKIIRNIEKLDPADKEKLIYRSLAGLGSSVKKADQAAGVFSVWGERKHLVDSIMNKFLGEGKPDDFVNWFIRETLMELPEKRAAKILASMFTAKAQKLSRSEMVALFMERAGIMTTKAGQILSTRPDLVPEESDRIALSRLKGNTNVPLDKEYLLNGRRNALGKEAEKILFKNLLGKASTRGAYSVERAGQKEPEIFKAFRSDMFRTVAEDLFVYDRIVAKLEADAQLRKNFGIADPRGEFMQIRINLLEESDSVQESANAKRMQKRLQQLGRRYGQTPEVYEVSRNFMREQSASGRPIQKAVKEYGLDPQKMADKLAESILAQILRDGRVPVFHGDPHSENVFADSRGNLHFIDRGLVGSLSQNTRGAVFGLMRAVSSRSPSAAANALLSMRVGETSAEAMRSLIEAKAKELFDSKTADAEAILYLVSEAKKLGMSMPRDIFTMAKTFYTMDGVVRDLGATVSYESIIRREYYRHLAGMPLEWVKSLWQNNTDKSGGEPVLGQQTNAPESEWRAIVQQMADSHKLSAKAKLLIEEAFTEAALFSSPSQNITSKRVFDALSLAYLRLEDAYRENTARDRAVLLEILKHDSLQEFAKGRCSDPRSMLNAITQTMTAAEITVRVNDIVDKSI